MSLTTAEQMALAVLKGDLLAARALADMLLENTAHGAVQLPPVKVLTTADPDRIRVVAYLKDVAETDQDAMTELQVALSAWVRGSRHPVIPLVGIDRIEVYELPPLPRATAKDTDTFQYGSPYTDEIGKLRLPIGKVRLPPECMDPREYD